MGIEHLSMSIGSEEVADSCLDLYLKGLRIGWRGVEICFSNMCANRFIHFSPDQFPNNCRISRRVVCKSSRNFFELVLGALFLDEMWNEI